MLQSDETRCNGASGHHLDPPDGRDRAPREQPHESTSRRESPNQEAVFDEVEAGDNAAGLDVPLFTFG
jgi:hypothetical protein